jgi:hypothetical protein
MAREISWATEMAIQEIIQDTRNQGRFWEWRAPSPAKAGGAPRAPEPHRSTRHTLHEPEMGIEDVDVLGECGQKSILEAFREEHRLRADRKHCPNCAVDAEDFKCGCMSDREILELQQEDDRHGGSPFLVATDGGFDKETEARGVKHDCTAAAVLCVVNIKREEGDERWQNVPLGAERWQVPARAKGGGGGGGAAEGRPYAPITRLSRALMARSSRLPTHYGYEPTENTAAELVGIELAEHMMPLDARYITVTDAEAARDVVRAARLQSDPEHSTRGDTKRKYNTIAAAIRRSQDKRHEAAQGARGVAPGIQGGEEGAARAARVELHKRNVRNVMSQAQGWVGEGDRPYRKGYADPDGYEHEAYTPSLGVNSHQVDERGTVDAKEEDRRHVGLAPNGAIVSLNRLADEQATKAKELERDIDEEEATKRAVIRVGQGGSRFYVAMETRALERGIGDAVRRAHDEEMTNRYRRRRHHGAVVRLWDRLWISSKGAGATSVTRRLWTGRGASWTRMGYASPMAREWMDKTLNARCGLVAEKEGDE